MKTLFVHSSRNSSSPVNHPSFTHHDRGPCVIYLPASRQSLILISHNLTPPILSCVPYPTDELALSRYIVHDYLPWFAAALFAAKSSSLFPLSFTLWGFHLCGVSMPLVTQLSFRIISRPVSPLHWRGKHSFTRHPANSDIMTNIYPVYSRLLPLRRPPCSHVELLILLPVPSG